MGDIKTSNFKRLIGTWVTSGQVFTEKGIMELKGTDSYEWILDGNFILHKADVTMGNEKSETFEMVILETPIDKAQMKYFNSKGESGTMQSELKDNAFNIQGNGIKFNGTINNENTEIVGKWYLRSESKGWERFIELKLKKANQADFEYPL